MTFITCLARSSVPEQVAGSDSCTY